MSEFVPTLADMTIAYIATGEIIGVIVAWQCGKWNKKLWREGLAIVLICTLAWPAMAGIRRY